MSSDPNQLALVEAGLTLLSINRDQVGADQDEHGVWIAGYQLLVRLDQLMHRSVLPRPLEQREKVRIVHQESRFPLSGGEI
jgi:hypothetical protein